MELAMSHPLVGKEEADHSFVDDDPAVFQVELDPPLLEGVRPDDDLVRKTEVKPMAPRGAPCLKELVS